MMGPVSAVSDSLYTFHGQLMVCKLRALQPLGLGHLNLVSRPNYLVTSRHSRACVLRSAMNLAAALDLDTKK